MAPLTTPGTGDVTSRSVPAAVLFVEPGSFRIIEAIEPAEPLLGVSCAELRGTALSDLHPSTAEYEALFDDLTSGSYHVRRSLSNGASIRVTDREGTPPVEIEATRITSGEEPHYRIVYRSRPCHGSIRVSPKRFRDIVDANPTPIAVIDAADTYLYANPAYCELIGRDPGDVLGTDIRTVLEPETISEIEPHLATARSEGTARFETERLVSPAERRVFEATYTHFEDEGGSVTGVIGTFNDVTERKRREEELEELFDGMDDAVFVHTTDGPFEVVNEAAVERYGYTEAELLSMSPRSLDVPEEVEAVQPRLDQIRQRGTAVFETVHETKAGDRIPVEISSTLIQFKGKPTVLSIARDISKRKASERRFEKLFSNASVAIVQVHFDGMEPIVESVNPTFLDLVQPDEQDVVDTRLATVFSTSTDQHERSELYRRIRREGNIGLELTRETTDGTRDFHFQSIPIDQENDAYFFIYSDITDRKERERRLLLQRDELATLNQLNEVIFDLIHVLVDVESRDQLMQTVCEKLANSSLFDAAWIGETSPEEPTLMVKASAAGESPAANSVAVGDDIVATGPLNESLETGSVQIAKHQERFTPVLDHREDLSHEGTAVAAVPIVLDGDVVYVLTITTSREYAFRSRELVAIETLGKVLEFANAAITNRRVLSAETVVELEFEFAETTVPLVEAARDLDCVIRSEGVVYSAEEGTQNVFLTVEGASPAAFLDRLRPDSQVRQARQLTESEDGTDRFEISFDIPAFASIETRHDATLAAFVVDSDTARFVFELPLASDARAVRETLQKAYPSIEFVAKREIELESTTVDSKCAKLRESFTDRQNEVLETAFLSGYFQWPRKATTEELSDSLDISPSTVQYHLRMGLQQLVEAAFEQQADRTTNSDT